MDAKQARELIFERLCREYKERGEDARLNRHTLPDELGIPSHIFKEAMESFTPMGGGVIIELDEDNDYIKLGPGGIARCMKS